MKKNNIKGFVLAEVIVVSVVVISALIVIYMQFISVNNGYYRSFKYNTIDDLYAVEDIRSFIEKDNMDRIVEQLKDNVYIDLSDCSYNYFIEYNYCENLLDTLNVKTLIITYEDVTNLKNNLNSISFSEGLKSFIKTISANKNNKYRLIVEFEDDRYATLKMGEIIYKLTNLVKNGSFEKGEEGWMSFSSNPSLSISSEFFKYGHYSVKNYNGPITSGAYTGEIQAIANHKYYVSVWSYDQSSSCYTGFSWKYNNTDNWKDLKANADKKLNYWYKSSLLTLAPDYSKLTGKVVLAGIGSDESNIGCYGDNVLVIDLTETFGAGKEPSQEWCDNNIKWFEGTIEISYDNL